jgi:restriction system protein
MWEGRAAGEDAATGLSKRIGSRGATPAGCAQRWRVEESEPPLMTIPGYQAIMLPLLQELADGTEHSVRDLVDRLGDEFGLTPEERRELLPSGQQPVFYNRVGWARTYLKKAGLVDSPRRGQYRITDRGRRVLAQSPAEIDVAFLEQFPSFIEFRTHRGETQIEEPKEVLSQDQTPEEQIEAAYAALRRDLASEMLDTVRNCSPGFFERLVVDLLIAMGYGGTRRDAGTAIGRSGDGGIDGIINQDRLGLDVVYIQAKRWGSPVGSPEIQKFVGALHGNHARRGIFITTSSFTQNARDYATGIDNRVILIDGDMLGQLMIDYNVGVATIAAFELKRIDIDYFSEE